MATAHAAEAITVGELLGGSRLFGVPQYQRAYSWRKKEADQLLTDLLREHQAIVETGDKDRNYYLSQVIIIDNTPPRRAMRAFGRGQKAASEIVDGKQRLTTLTMLIAILRDLLGPEGASLETYLVETGKNRAGRKARPDCSSRGTSRNSSQNMYCLRARPACACRRISLTRARGACARSETISRGS